MYKNSFKDMLKYFRERKGLTQSELAKAVGLGSSTISMYELGSREPNFEIEERLADFFNVDLNTLRGRRIYEDMPELDERARRIIEYYKRLTPEMQDSIENILINSQPKS